MELVEFKSQFDKEKGNKPKAIKPALVALCEISCAAALCLWSSGQLHIHVFNWLIFVDVSSNT